MATTTNFGWVTPDDTSLVKDGAAAIRTLGQSIDTSMMDLEGGTTGQVLSKTSNTDMDFTWITPSTGKLLQLVQVSYSTSTTVASTSLTDTGLSATITPTKTTSKILVLVNQAANFERFSAPIGFNLNLLRGSTNIFAQNGSENTGSVYSDGSYNQLRTIAAFSYLDSPNTTSATTYKTQGSASTTANSGQVKFQSGSAISTITLMEIGA
jgi:hypothetical protein